MIIDIYERNVHYSYSLVIFDMYSSDVGEMNEQILFFLFSFVRLLVNERRHCTCSLFFGSTQNTDNKGELKVNTLAYIYTIRKRM